MFQERMRYIVKIASAIAKSDVTQEGGVKNVRAIVHILNAILDMQHLFDSLNHT